MYHFTLLDFIKFLALPKSKAELPASKANILLLLFIPFQSRGHPAYYLPFNVPFPQSHAIVRSHKLRLRHSRK